MPKEVTPVIWLDTTNTSPFKLECKVVALSLSCCLLNRRISRKEEALHFFSKFCKEPALPNTSSASDNNKTSASFVQKPFKPGHFSVTPYKLRWLHFSSINL